MSEDFDPAEHNADAVLAYVKEDPVKAAEVLVAEENGKARTTLVVALQRIAKLGLSEPKPAAPKVESKVIQVAGEFGPYDRYMEVPTVRGIFGIAPGEVLVVPEDRGEKVTYRKV